MRKVCLLRVYSKTTQQIIMNFCINIIKGIGKTIEYFLLKNKQYFAQKLKKKFKKAGIV